MQLILNDYSLNGQFESIEDDFAEYFINVMLPIMEILTEKNIALLKKSDFYSRKITQNETIYDVLRRANDPIFTKWKRYIVQMAFDEPYWDSNPKTKEDIEYLTPALDESPNCFSEAIERNITLFSFPYEDYKRNTIFCWRDGEKCELENIYELGTLLFEYLSFNEQDIRYVIERYPYSGDLIVECVEIKGKCHCDEALLSNGLEYDDYINIVTDIPKLWSNLVTGTKTEMWDSFGKGLFEYRQHVSSGRIFRIFFTVKDKKLCFLNGFIKKTQVTPQNELEKAKKLLRNWTNSSRNE